MKSTRWTLIVILASEITRTEKDEMVIILNSKSFVISVAT